MSRRDYPLNEVATMVSTVQLAWDRSGLADGEHEPRRLLSLRAEYGTEIDRWTFIR